LAHCRGQLKAKEVHTKIQDYTATNLIFHYFDPAIYNIAIQQSRKTTQMRPTSLDTKKIKATYFSLKRKN